MQRTSGDPRAFLIAQKIVDDMIGVPVTGELVEKLNTLLQAELVKKDLDLDSVHIAIDGAYDEHSSARLAVRVGSPSENQGSRQITLFDEIMEKPGQ